MTDAKTLERLTVLAREAGAPAMAAEAAALLQRAREGRFYVACVGEFKRGKSTLINALLGSTLLPTGVVPVTSVPTVLRYGQPAARVQQRGRWHDIEPHRIADYVSQEGNPGNAKGVTGVEVLVPHPLLEHGLCLVDTPGLGSVFDANTASTVDFLPQIDAAIVVLGADPPISGEELRFVTELRSTIDTLLFVLNKSDRLPAAERTEAIRFSHDVLQTALGSSPGPIYEVSAIANHAGPGSEGWQMLVDELGRLPRTSGRHLVDSALTRGINRLGGQLARLIEEEHHALIAPLEESERHVAALQALAAHAERAATELEPLLALAERDLAATFAERRRVFLTRIQPVASTELGRGFDDRLRHMDALELANDIARAQLEPWLQESEREAEHAYRDVLSRFGSLARDFVARTASLAGVTSELLQFDPATLSDLSAPSGFYFTNLWHYHVSPYPWSGLVDRLLPRPIARRRRLNAAHRYLAHLLEVNATRVESDLTARVYESRIRVRSALEKLLRDVANTALVAAARGREARLAGKAATDAALERLERWRADLATMVTV